MVFSRASVLSALAVGAFALPSTRQVENANWPGWDNIKHAFIFGDSYTQTGFDYTSTQPSASNPFGNPTYPGWTSSNGPNWVGYLTFQYNASLLQTYNLAYGGATVDSALVPPYAPTVISLKEQVQSQYLPGYTSNASTAPKWTGSDSIFASWIGINDVGNSYYRDDYEALSDQIFVVYSGLVDQLYDSGARNFVFINVPPIDRSPLILEQGDWAIEHERSAIASWNAKVGALIAALKEKHPDEVNVWLIDSNQSFNEVIDDPAAYPQTAGLKNTTGYCTAYQNGTPAQDTLDPSCGVAANEYFWLNNLHPTSPIHAVVAKQVADALTAGPSA